MKTLKSVLKLCVILSLLAMPVLAANDTLQMPSAIRGWNAMPTEGKTWAQTLLDWGAAAVIIVAVGALLYHFIRGRFADQSGSIAIKNDSTSKMIEVVIAGIILIVAIGFIWMVFWK